MLSPINIESHRQNLLSIPTEAVTICGVTHFGVCRAKIPSRPKTVANMLYFPAFMISLDRKAIVEPIWALNIMASCHFRTMLVKPILNPLNNAQCLRCLVSNSSEYFHKRGSGFTPGSGLGLCNKAYACVV